MTERDEFEPFKIKHNGIPPTKGATLLSVPLLRDMYFKKTVIYLTEHNGEGTIGFIINKQMDFHLHQLLEGLPESPLKVFYGGPVANDTIHFVHTLGDRILNSKQIAGGLCWGGDYEQVKSMLKKDITLGRYFKFFLGYSGWDPGQLELEVAEDTWLVTNVSVADVINNTEVVRWETVLENMGRKYKLWAQFPEDSAFN